MCISLKCAFIWRKYYSLVAAVSVALHIIQCHEIVPQTNNHTPGTAQVSSSPYGFCLTHPPTLCALAPLNTNIGRILRTCTPPQVPSSRYQPPAISPAPLYVPDLSRNASEQFSPWHWRPHVLVPRFGTPQVSTPNPEIFSVWKSSARSELQGGENSGRSLQRILLWGIF